ncbi:MAG: adenylate/guanylate cyclase domain-containing protein [Bacteroidia bacterium]
MPSRRLAAIMFADIVGYTAMMQRNEQEGLAKVRRFSEVIESEVQANEGEVLQFMGDGCLCIFHSAVQAMHAAQAIQLALKVEPQVPLRIGIHIGDIVMQEGNIYGDGVNLASRVESMGVPGSILVTERVIHDVKSHPEFEMVSLGNFQFKNVDNPMEVFALANAGLSVPRRGELKGKLAPNPKQKARVKLKYLWLALGLFALIGGLVWYSTQPAKPEAGLKPVSSDPIIAVLPFRDLSAKQDQAFFCEGTAEEILNALSKLQGIKVLGRGSSFSFQDKQLPLKEIGQQLNATVLLDGSVRRAGNNIRVNVQLINVEDESTLWSKQYDQQEAEIFAIQEEIARKVLDQLQITLLPGESQSLLAEQTQNPQAYEWYLKGSYALNAGASKIDEAIEHLEKAVALDSGYYFAYVKLGIARFKKGIFSSEDAYFEKGKQTLQRAIELNPNLPDAYAHLSEVVIMKDAAPEESEKLIKTAISLGYPSVNKYSAYVLIAKGQIGEGIGIMEAIVEKDPLSVLAKATLSRVYLMAREYEKELAFSAEVLAQYPGQSSVMRHRGEAMLHLGMADEALPLYQELVEYRGYAAYGLVICYQRLGQETKARELLEQYRSKLRDVDLAFYYVESNQTDSAFYYLERSLKAKELGILYARKNDFLEPLRSDPRYQAMLKQYLPDLPSAY